MFKFSLLILILISLLMFVLPIFYTISPYELNPSKILLSPSIEHIFGTDILGRDVFARILQGGQTSLIIGFLAASFSSFLGLIIGITAGYFKGNVDRTITVIIDLFLTFPTFFLLLALVSYIEANLLVLIVVISITSWMGMSRMIRSESFALSNKAFIKILKISNVSKKKIILKYFAPLLAPIFLISFSFGVAGAILAESGLSFLGLGINPPNMSWGSLLSDGRSVIDIAWWLSFFPGLMIFIITFCLIQISDYLQNLANKKD
ncbi:Oligopeptide transport system permease protein OppC [Aliarcobacter thereius]|uniref:ABC transporter permease n=3 Tax=Aliarcobacter thereius TaxID=544718 RepID=A0A5R9H5X2_9BACT|nr:ABC transporter permease [Aliarcobacter thereius]OCL87084.1 Oligopeptide transport system permease protein OppC [Aliarcobacter thereius]OCL91267.1 Oligopeptide transport system permease protein OppC [Aliarcobacter thereius]OCL95897.1 Oligopeptide transport system permease protein OppC [Aliarcobacter thereius LMG 24486]QBF16130.1 ABC transporter, permease protein [Aliarcobacter thereius LMG 24486]TLS71806.1 ABC transporter permease [Aliarcobacter thereius]